MRLNRRGVLKFTEGDFMKDCEVMQKINHLDHLLGQGNLGTKSKCSLSGALLIDFS